MKTLKNIVEEVFSIPTTKYLWTSTYFPALPITPQGFSMGAVLPAILYMFRWGHRRGKGAFMSTFGENQISPPTIENITSKLVVKSEWFEGFESSVEQAILGDMLLSFCLENKKHQIGRNEQVQRAYATHYMASWIDLPQAFAHLRFIPEMLVTLLLNQEDGEYIIKNKHKSQFSVWSGFQDNIFLRLLGNSMDIGGEFQRDLNLTSDRFLEVDDQSNILGLDQLLTIRIAQLCGSAPMKAKGKGESDSIINQHPLAKRAANYFREDLSVFIQAYGEYIPRQTFLQMLESCFALGLTTIFLSTASMLLEWEKTGELIDCKDQKPWPLFVDCSCGNNMKLRALAEESMADFMRRFDRLPIVMMCLRILEERVRFSKKLRDNLPPILPDATEYINVLGSILKGSHSRSEKIMEEIYEKCITLAESLEEDNQEPALQNILKQDTIHPLIRLAEVLCAIMGSKSQQVKYIVSIDSCLMIDLPHGLAMKRKTQKKATFGKKNRTEARAIIFTNCMLDFLVHRHLRKAAQNKGPVDLTFVKFITLLKDRYGLYVSEAPPGMSIPTEMLYRNRQILERRLRDLGVLIGVNDAESMKRLQQRFNAKGDNDVE